MVDSGSSSRPLSAGNKTRFLRAVLALGSEAPVRPQDKGTDAVEARAASASPPDEAQTRPDAES